MTYTVPESEFDGFLKTGVKRFMSKDLASAIVKQFGGYSGFSSSYYHITLQGIRGVKATGFEDKQVVVDFFEAYRESLLDFLADMGRAKNYHSIVDFLLEFPYIKGVLSLSEVYKAVYDKDVTHRADIAVAIVLWAAESLCDDYYDYMSDYVGVTF